METKHDLRKTKYFSCTTNDKGEITFSPLADNVVPVVIDREEGSPPVEQEDSPFGNMKSALSYGDENSEEKEEDSSIENPPPKEGEYTITFDDEVEINVKHPNYELINTIWEEQKRQVPSTCKLVSSITDQKVEEVLPSRLTRLKYIDELHTSEYMFEDEGDSFLCEDNNEYPTNIKVPSTRGERIQPPPVCEYCNFSCKYRNQKKMFYCETCDKKMCSFCFEEINKKITRFNGSEWKERHELLKICRAHHKISKRHIFDVCRKCFESVDGNRICSACTEEGEEKKKLQRNNPNRYLYKYGDFEDWIPILTNKEQSHHEFFLLVNSKTKNTALLAIDDHGRSGLARLPINFRECLDFLEGKVSITEIDTQRNCDGECGGKMISHIPYVTDNEDDYCLACAFKQNMDEKDEDKEHSRSLSSDIRIISMARYFGMMVQYG